MIEKKSVYKCNKCGAVVEALWNGEQTISCCNTPMVKLEPNTTDGAKEKHVPVIEKDGNKVTVKVGEVPHPMTKGHYILFVELLAADKVLRHDFKEGDNAAEAVFFVENENVPLTAREYCNLHGFWGTK
ncbi:MAG TPA: desulfoferrodoxin [Chitinispirillaceae bacterium]|nr:desulfoferrodoxin [Chitinispirillaceae bacterium]